MVILVVAGAVAAKAMVGGWHPPASPKRRRAKEPGGARTHYRTATADDDEDVDGDAPEIDASLPPGDRRALLALWRAYRDGQQSGDAAAMRAAAERALAFSSSSAVRSYARRVRAYALAISGEARAAVDDLRSVDNDPTGIDDPAIDLRILMRARRYKSAQEQARRMLLTGDAYDVAALFDIIDAEAAQWDAAVARLVEGTACADGAEYALVCEAGVLKGRSDDAARIGELMFEAEPDPDLAWVLAACWLRARDRERAMDWALRAAAAGSREWERLETAELAALTKSDRLAELRAALEAPGEAPAATAEVPETS